MEILGTHIDGIRRKEALDRVRGFLAGEGQHMIVTPNPEILVAAHRDREFRKILNHASLSIPDGFGVVIMSALFDSGVPERITGTDFLDDLMCLADETGYRVCFVGGAHDSVPCAARNHFVKRYPSLQIVHAESGGVVERNDCAWSMDSELLNRIRDAAPTILVIGFGHGKQEQWIADHMKALPSVKVAIGVGGALDFWAGEVRRAPRWMRQMGIEWLWRLAIEPRRWKRMIIAVIIFPYYVFKNRLFNRRTVPWYSLWNWGVKSMKVRVRFAPSPTGFLHIGGLRTAFYNFLFTRRHGGVFILRIEDTDRARFVEGGIENIIRTLGWAGMHWDEGLFLDARGELFEKGDKGPYVQSARLDIYKKYALELVKKGSAYHCFCTSEQLEVMRRNQEAHKEPPRYDKTCTRLSPDEVRARLSSGTPHVIRFNVPTSGETVVFDTIHGEVRFKNELIDDQVLMKSDGFPTYHLANVVDDHLMEITHVIRGDEWLPSMPKHVLLYQAFGWKLPQFAHLPLLLNKDRSKLSKRTGDVAVEEYQKKGYLPEALVNFVALLGWNPTGEREVYTLDELVHAFALEKVNKSGAVVNFEKLKWLNSEYIKKLDLALLTQKTLPWLISSGLLVAEEGSEGYAAVGLGREVSQTYLEAALGLARERLETLGDAPPLLEFLFTRPLYDPNLLMWKKMTPDMVRERLTATKSTLEVISSSGWTKDALERILKEVITRDQLGTGETLWPLRVALTGRGASPSPFDVAAVLGKEETLARIDAALVGINSL